MSLISIPNTFTVGAVIVASQHNSNFSTIYSDYNGNIDNTNLSAFAAIVDTKLAVISTAGKVSGAALTSLASIPSGAGLIPVANIDTGTTANKIVILNGSSQIPAISGALLTNLPSQSPASILDYGTSASASTSRAITVIKIAFGSLTISGNSNTAITNLPFTSSSSYIVLTTFGTATDATEACVAVRNTASQVTLYNNDNLSQACMWYAIGI